MYEEPFVQEIEHKGLRLKFSCHFVQQSVGDNIPSTSSIN